MAKTPNRTVRSPDRIWNLARRKSKRIGTPLARVINAYLWEWTRDERERCKKRRK